MFDTADHIVVIDDDQEVLAMQQEALKRLAAAIHTFADPIAAWEFIRQNPPALVVTDWNMPALSGMELLFKIRALSRPPHVILLTAYGTIQRAVMAMNEGAFSFLEKPFKIDSYLELVKDALARFRSGATGTAVPEHKGGNGKNRDEPVFRSRAITQLYAVVRSAAATDSSILLLGESGSGKEVIADYIHRHSRRAAAPIIKVNCAALPEHLMESELFGHEKGSFTGAVQRSTGRFEQAGGGTLFLDEVADLLPNLQVKLLRALQERIIERVGSGTPIPVDFRLICATHQDLKAAVAQGRFREDLYYRVNVIPLTLPPLRERREDIEPLALHFFGLLREKLPKPPQRISPEALRALVNFSWPGNVRQLRNAIEYALVMAKGETVAVPDLPSEIRLGGADGGVPEASDSGGSALPAGRAQPDDGLRNSVKKTEAELINAALERHHWQVSRVARELKISRSSLYTRMNEFGITRPQ